MDAIRRIASLMARVDGDIERMLRDDASRIVRSVY